MYFGRLLILGPWLVGVNLDSLTMIATSFVPAKREISPLECNFEAGIIRRDTIFRF